MRTRVLALTAPKPSLPPARRPESAALVPEGALSRLWGGLTSLKLTIACLVLLMILVVACTLAQVSLGTYGAVKVTMRSLFVWWPVGGSWKIPVFPGGGLVGGLLLVNLAASQSARLERSWRKAGLWIVHLGLILLFLGEFATGLFQVETQMAIDEGATLDYSESPRDSELAVVDATDGAYDEVTSVPESLLSRRRSIPLPGLPFGLEIREYVANRPAAEDERGQVSALVELTDGGRSLGTRLLSIGLAPQSLTYRGRTYRLAIRPTRHYLPFRLTLKDFRHDVYPGTDVPRNFSSLLRLADPRSGEERDVLVSMNEPLRYGGKAFYQASFGKDDTMSVLQVVENPGWLLPYLACALVSLGLMIHFLMRLSPALGTPRP